MDGPSGRGGGGRRGLRRILFVAIACLYVASVPWYRAPGAQTPVWCGLPEWAAVAVLCYVLIALLNAVAWLLREAPVETREPSE